MKLKGTFLLVFGLLFFIFCLFAIEKDDEQKEIAQIFQKRIDAIHSRNLSLIEQIYAHEPNAIYFRDQKIYKGWSDYRNYWEAGLRNLTSHIKLSFKDLEIHRFGNNAWCTMTYHIDIKDEQGKLSKTWGYMTVILEKRDSRWQIIHENIGPSYEVPST